MWLIKSLKWGIVILKFPSMIFAQRAIYVRALGSCWTDLSLLKKNWATWTSPWYPAQTLAREGGSSCACQGILFNFLTSDARQLRFWKHLKPNLLEICEGEEFFIDFVFLCSEPHLWQNIFVQNIIAWWHYDSDLIWNVFSPDGALSHRDSEKNTALNFTTQRIMGVGGA